MSDLSENPFSVQSPESMTAQETAQLFVEPFTDFYKILSHGHTFIQGSRGSGKSMIFRYLQPDCQCIAKECSLKELEFFGVHVPIKTTDLKVTELARLLNRNANVLLNEHFMCIHIAGRIFRSMMLLTDLKNDGYSEEFSNFIQKIFIPLLEQCGWERIGETTINLTTMELCISYLQDKCNKIYTTITAYFKRLIREPIQPYLGPLCGYLDFIVPLLIGLRKLSFMPSGPIYLMLDDADNLNSTQTMILNSWVSTRTQEDVCLKISTQLRYKTYKTIAGDTIETPHDYQDIDLSTIYTTSRFAYHKRVQDIIMKRFALANIQIHPDAFFPPDKEQEEKIKKIGEEIRKRWETEGKGNRASDDVVRYARPNFIASLKGRSKSGSTYSYAGFDQLVHLSSGIIRYFLHPASLMFSQEKAESKEGIVKYIRPSIQNTIVREQAAELIYKEFERIQEDENESDNPEGTRITNQNIQKLGNLIQALGGTFHLILISERSERRVFSIAFSDEPDAEIITILKLGIQYGYFHSSSIGNKEGTGRTRLYVLTRRLAPFFTLDASSFTGYLFVKSDAIRRAMYNPQQMLRSMKQIGADKYMEENQLSLVFPEDKP